MARKKSQQKAKEPVRLRFKTLANGNKSIYLDMYRKGQREYEFLKLYLIPESTPLDKWQNEQTLQAANAIKAQRIIEITNSEAGLKQIGRGKMLLADWLQRYYELRKDSSHTTKWHILKMAEIIALYAGKGVQMKDIDKEFCANFAHWLMYDYMPTRGSKNPTPPKNIQKSTAYNYYSIFNFSLNEAVRQGIIEHNPCKMLSPAEKIKKPESQREYLTTDDVRKLIETPCKHPASKQAFLFSCFCGLRISDVLRLEWGNIVTDKGQARIIITMKKTKAPLYLPLSKQALKYLPDRNNAASSDRVFNLRSAASINKHLTKWAEEAGVKHISFHTARHTFATALLTEGADLYTVSKLLGHAEIATTQIYAKIIDKKKDRAVSLLDNMFNN